MELIIENISKKYPGGVVALKNINICITKGILGLLGSNGAGKSTLMRIISTIIKPTHGKVLYQGIDIVKKPELIQRQLGYLPQDFGVYDHLNVVEFLEYLAVIKGMDRNSIKKVVPEILEIVNLHNTKKTQLRYYSGGMKQRVGIAQALLNNPNVLILDEPTVGLDPGERLNFKNLLSELSRDKIVILSTHIVSDIEGYATNIAIMNQGEVVINDNGNNLIDHIDRYVWEAILTDTELQKIKKIYIISESIRSECKIIVRIISEIKPPVNCKMVPPNLHDVYLYYTFLKNGGEVINH